MRSEVPRTFLPLGHASDYDHISTVVFDLDGTLLDTMACLTDLAVDVICNGCGLSREVVRETYVATSGLPFREQLAIMLPRQIEQGAIHRDFERRKMRAMATVDFGPATLSALYALRSAGYRLAISSNTTQELVDRVQRTCEGVFDAALGCGAGLRKGRSHVREICKRLRCTPRDLVFVGDSLNDLRLAQEAGIAFVAKLGTFTREQFHACDAAVPCVNDVSELAVWLSHGRRHRDEKSSHNRRDPSGRNGNTTGGDQPR